MSNSLKEYIRLVVREGQNARVPNQLVSDDKESSGNSGNDKGEVEDVQEFSSVGGGSIMGYSLPLGMNPDAAGRQKNRLRRKKKK